jgi:hypothetical protein
MKEDPAAPLHLYLGFTSLPAVHVALLFEALSNIYTLVEDDRRLPMSFLDPDFPLHVLLERREANLDSQLCLDFARSGNSMDFRFSGRATANGRSRARPNKGKISVILATVGSIIALAGQGQIIMDRHADSVLQRELAKTLSDLQAEKVRAEIERIRSEMNHRGTHDEPDSHQQKRRKLIVRNVKVVQQVINAPNITNVVVNGIPLKQEPPTIQDDDDIGPRF